MSNATLESPVDEVKELTTTSEANEPVEESPDNLYQNLLSTLVKAEEEVNAASVPTDTKMSAEVRGVAQTAKQKLKNLRERTQQLRQRFSRVFTKKPKEQAIAIEDDEWEIKEYSNDPLPFVSYDDLAAQEEHQNTEESLDPEKFNTSQELYDLEYTSIEEYPYPTEQWMIPQIHGPRININNYRLLVLLREGEAYTVHGNFGTLTVLYQDGELIIGDSMEKLLADERYDADDLGLYSPDELKPYNGCFFGV